MFRRDASGPMDVDDAHPLGTAAQYALDDGPARKRPHSDLSSNNPFLVPSSSSYKFGPNTPFLFHAPPLPPAPKFEPYDPNRWARTDFGFGSSAAAQSTEVDMDANETPTIPAVPGAAATPASPTPARPKAKKKAERKKAAKVVDEEDEEDEDDDERPIATGAVARVRRRRQQWAKRNDEASHSEHTYNLHMANPAVHHSEVPVILLNYVQFVFNASLVVGFLYVATQFILAVRRDVQERIEEYSVEILHEIAGCTQAYLTNRCEPSLRVPAMEAACSAWETCMNRDPKVVGRARVGAETFAGVINSFVDPISWKTMGFTLVTLTFLIILTNSALFNLRAKHQHNHQPPPPPQQNMMPYMVPGALGHMGQMGQLGYGGMQMGMPMDGQNGHANGNANGNGNGNAITNGGEKKSGVAKALGWLTK